MMSLSPTLQSMSNIGMLRTNTKVLPVICAVTGAIGKLEWHTYIVFELASQVTTSWKSNKMKSEGV